MRPLHLEIRGIGPFAGVEQVPFDRLSEGGLYLITGDTGAGKTTIFDSVCFALFGEVSGDAAASCHYNDVPARNKQRFVKTIDFPQATADSVTHNGVS